MVPGSRAWCPRLPPGTRHTDGVNAAAAQRDVERGGGALTRVDAQRNRAKLFTAAATVLMERGPGAPLDEIARRAKVGIATLYRHFPDRSALMRAVALDLLDRVAAEAAAALAEQRDPFEALARYMHTALEQRISAIMPAVAAETTLEDEEMTAARDRSAVPIQAIIDAAQAAGSLRADVAFADISLLLVRLTRPLPGGIPATLDNDLAHRHLDIVLDGLQARQNRPLRGPALNLAELRQTPDDPTADCHDQPRT